MHTQRDRVARLKAAQQKNREDEGAASRALWEFERDAHIEDLARQRILLKELTQRKDELVCVRRRSGIFVYAVCLCLCLCLCLCQCRHCVCTYL